MPIYFNNINHKPKMIWKHFYLSYSESKIFHLTFVLHCSHICCNWYVCRRTYCLEKYTVSFTKAAFIWTNHGLRHKYPRFRIKNSFLPFGWYKIVLIFQILFSGVNTPKIYITIQSSRLCMYYDAVDLKK